MKPGRIATYVVVILVLGSILYAPAILSGRAADAQIDLTAKVSSAECTVCHAQIGGASRPGLIFSHGAHLLVACDACHTRPPHEDGNTYRPTMQSCFLCHGLEHGPQGLIAAGECSSCHAPDFDLRPLSHVKTWAKAPHARATRTSGTNACIMCHEPSKDCDACHKEQGLDIEPIPAVYHRIMPVRPELPPVVIDPNAPPSMGSCVFCHPDIDTQGDPGLIFTHDAHISRDFECDACHEEFPHKQDRNDRPSMVSCYRCHSLQHSDQGEVAPQKCEDCHPKEFELKPADHTKAFATGEHKKGAAERMIECAMCHASGFCAECHKGGKKMADGNLSQPVIPEDHRKPEWQPEHGASYLAQRGSCSTCHTPDYCVACHVTPMPHPTEWLVKHGENGYPTKDCRVCHSDRSNCQECHHQGLIAAELIRKNCIHCHEEMKAADPTTIKEVSLAEHAVHFNVAESIGRPYVCEDCHIGFTATSVMAPAQSTQVHDLRVCYDCHGNLDVKNVLIAPYPGKQLCYRCHKELNL